MHGPGDRATKHLNDGGADAFTLGGRPRWKAREEWVWAIHSPRGPRARHVHNCLLNGSRETSEVPRRRWWMAGSHGKVRNRKPWSEPPRRRTWV